MQGCAGWSHKRLQVLGGCWLGAGAQGDTWLVCLGQAAVASWSPGSCSSALSAARAGAGCLGPSRGCLLGWGGQRGQASSRILAGASHHG